LHRFCEYLDAQFFKKNHAAQTATFRISTYSSGVFRYYFGVFRLNLPASGHILENMADPSCTPEDVRTYATNGTFPPLASALSLIMCCYSLFLQSLSKARCSKRMCPHQRDSCTSVEFTTAQRHRNWHACVIPVQVGGRRIYLDWDRSGVIRHIHSPHSRADRPGLGARLRAVDARQCQTDKGPSFCQYEGRARRGACIGDNVWLQIKWHASRSAYSNESVYVGGLMVLYSWTSISTFTVCPTFMSFGDTKKF
jgi:hypothetical protein